MNRIRAGKRFRQPKWLAGCLTMLALGGLMVSARAQAPIELDVAAPELVGGPWLNTAQNKPIKLAERKGKVTVVEFWTFGCINCQRNLPIYARWNKQFQKKGVVLIGVHTPETNSEKVASNVAREVKRLGITYPILLDQKGINWDHWGQQFWPTVYLRDKHGHVRYRWEGELEYQNAGGEMQMAAKINELLAEKG